MLRARRLHFHLHLLATVVLIAACGGGTGSSGQGAGDVSAAQLQGAWALTVSVSAITGPPAKHFMEVGHQAVDPVWFQSTCPSAGHCTLQIWGPAGPDSQKAAFFQFLSTASGLEAPPVSMPMTQAGDSYTAAVPIGGFGGRVACSPVAGKPAPTQQLTLRVTKAVQSSPAQGGAPVWVATALAGTETFDSGWSCSGSAFSGWVVTHLSIVGRPAA